ncbi:SIR2 family protein [Sphingobacterium thalpophilum]|uniref:SIR2 family protein n=1 Tax=Sphingobacterium thalpophilum TaxID=259 RepID=A0ABV4HIY0_9SPHI
MKKYKYIEYFPKPFLQDLVNNHCLPIIGAGFSKNADIPKNKKMLDWEELGRAIADDIQDYKYTNAIDAISAYCHEYSRTNLVEKLTQLLLLSSVKPGRTHKAFCELQFDIVCTTNFEFLLEQGYGLIPKYCRPIIDEDQLSISNSGDGITILKLHGDLHHPNKLVVTEEDYDRFLTKNPMLATYLANLLIIRTPLFIGYSLDDTDFRQIWQVIKDRLGNLRRQAYVLKIDCSPHEKARFERRGVKVINIKGNPADYPKILEEVFTELKEYWNNEVLKLPTVSEEATLAELALPDDTNNRLCFFSIPIKLLSFYKKYIFPIAANNGLVPISADDVISIGDNWIAKVTALINKAEFIVLDLATQNTMFELGLVMSENKHLSRLLVIQSENSPIPSDIQNLKYIVRPENPFDEIDQLSDRIEHWFRDVVEPLKTTYDEEPRRLLNKKEYRAAVISAMTLLEVYMRQRVEVFKSVPLKTTTPYSLYASAKEFGIINDREYMEIRFWSDTRNQLVHTKAAVTPAIAKRIVNGVYLLVQNN